MQDEVYMARALKLAQRGRFTTHPNPRVGCVIVRDGDIVGKVFIFARANPMPKCMRCGWRAIKPGARRPTSRWSPAAITGARRRAAMR